MVSLERGGFLSLLLKSAKNIVEEEVKEYLTEEPKEASAAETNTEPMQVYWARDKQELENKDVPFVDVFEQKGALERIPDSTPKPTIESKYDFDGLSSVFLPQLTERLSETSKVLANAPTNIFSGVTEGAPKTTTGLSNSGRDAGVVAGIVVAVISGVIILGALIAVVMYRHYVHRNVTSMNFDNPVYRKTTEDQFALEKNGYAPGSKLYPSTVGEEAQEPLNKPGTNEFV